ncbi:MAG: HAMP domain-containing histidine kinase [Lachnospiraceae bacterium]|nr:HAMP domain-containing histidine kinase [Lachnospiraceae bacterium]
MRLFVKIFLSFMLVLILALCSVEYCMVFASFEQALEQEVSHELEQFRFIRMVIYMGGTRTGERQLGERSMLLLAADGTVLYPGFSEALSDASKGMEQSGKITYVVRETEGRHMLFVAGELPSENTMQVLKTATDISHIYRERALLEKRYGYYIYAAMLVCGLLAAGISYVLVKPLKRLQRSADRIAMGEYAGRVRENGRDEIGELARSFNQMAEAVEQKVEELKLEAVRKEQFMGDFSHEIKTPMTAIIGYADTLYQKELSKKETKEAAAYILNEGMRLESLAKKMMRFIALDQEDFCFEEIPAEEFFEDVRETMEPFFSDGERTLRISFREGCLNAEWDLMKTLVINLIDNAKKAGSRRIFLRGEPEEGGYRITISDNGRGIPAESLPRIQDAFYMVDKSRSRKQNGAGLGLALCKKIAALHGTFLNFYSREGKGTTVTLWVPGRGERHAGEEPKTGHAGEEVEREA